MARSPFEITRQLEEGRVSITPLGVVALTAGEELPLRSLAIQGVLGKIQNAQAIWLDASAAPRSVRVLNQKTRQYVVFPPGSAGWQPMVIPTDATELQLLCAATCEVGLAVSSFPFITSLDNIGEINNVPDSRRVDINAVASDTKLLDANSRRKGYTAYNEGPDTLYLLENDGVASASNYTVILYAGDYFETPFNYGGEVRGIFSGTDGGVRITEYDS